MANKFIGDVDTVETITDEDSLFVNAEDKLRKIKKKKIKLDYENNLSNKPMVNGIELSGDKSLDSLGIGSKTAIDELSDKLNKCAPAIICEASGESIVVEDSSENYLNGLNVYGKSEQVKTNGYQLFDASKIQSKTMGGVTLTNNGDGSFTIGGEAISTSEFRSDYIYSVEETKELLKIGRLYKVETNSNSMTSPNLSIALIDQSGNIIPEKGIDTTKPSGSFIEVTQEDFDKGCRLKLNMHTSNGAPISVGHKIRPMLYQDGDGIWEPYTGGKPSPNPDYPQEIETAGEDGDVESIIIADDKLRTARLKYNAEYNYAYSSVYINSLFPEYIKPGQKITIVLPENIVNLVQRIIIQNNDSSNTNTNIGFSDMKKDNVVLTFKETLNPTAVNVIFLATIDDGLNEEQITMIKNAKILIIPGDRRYTRLTIPTPNGLPGIPVSSNGNYTDETGQQWVCDEIDFERGKYVRRVKKVVFDGSEDENWTIMNDPVTSGQKAARISVDAHGEETEFSKNIICNRFIPQTWGNGVKKYCFIDARTRFVFRDERISEVFEDATKVKEWLSKNNLELLYYLKTPIETDLSVEVIERYKKLHTNKPSTVVQNDSGAGMKMEYVADTKNFIQNQIAEVIKEQLRTNSLILERTV